MLGLFSRDFVILMYYFVVFFHLIVMFVWFELIDQPCYFVVFLSIIMLFVCFR